MEMKISTYDFLNKFILGLVFIGVVILVYRKEMSHILEAFQGSKDNTVLITVFAVSAYQK